MRRGLHLLTLASVVLVARGASALQQPDGTIIPTTNSLQLLFDARGEAIDALNAAATTPETFIPSCALTFEVVQRDSAYVNTFGWYNVTGQKPTTAELHEFIACTDGVGTIKTLDIKNDPSWAGGAVGFYEGAGPGCPTPMAAANIFYSEKAYNPDSSQQNPYIHLLIYNSTTTPKAFYFAWEDLLTGNDNDFNDLTMFVTGITCTGGGVPCDTGLLGVCAQGLLQCQNGMLTCVPIVQPQTESCDGFDNDCNDLIDEGDLCQEDYVCDKGVCVPACGSGEFQCPPGTACDMDGFCVDVDCLDVPCPTGEKCHEGECVGPCEDVVCPYGQVCQLGVCLDPCAPITCDADQVCEAGLCVDKCQCAGCDTDESCQLDGHCIPLACDMVTCPPGQHCDGQTGMCVDDCAGAVCPLGQICMSGFCVDDPAGQGGAGGGTGTFAAGTGGGATGSGGGATSGASGTGGAEDGGNTFGADGCDCSLPEDRSSGWAALGAVGLLGALWRARRRPRGEPPR
jgi:MYXO-CTERM domain-containing protein